MDMQTNAFPSLPEAVGRIIWRIVGNNESPVARETTARLIEQTIRRHGTQVPSYIQDQAIANVCGWFDFRGDRGWLREDMREPVASLIISGVKDALASQKGIDNHETAFCAVGSIAPGLAVNMISCSWSHEELDTFIDYAFKTLKTLSEKEAVLNADRMSLGVDGARASIQPVQGGKRLETYWALKDHDWWLYPSVANMIEFLVRLNPDHFQAIVERTDHPVIHLRAARCAIDRDESTDHYTPLRWLTKESNDSLVTLAIVHTLDNINRLDSDLPWRAEPGDKQDRGDLAASSLLESMIERLGELEPANCAQWIVELLNYGTSALNASGRDEKPGRVEQLDDLSSQQIERLARESWSDELVNVLRSGLSPAPFAPRILPLAQAAFSIWESEPPRSTEIVRLVLEAHEQQIAASLDDGRGFYYHMNSWIHRDWVNGLAIALVLSDRELDLLDWVSEKCRELPLSVWDVEEDYERFLNAENVAQFRFLVALHAIQSLETVGRTVDPAIVLALAESLWKHREFIGRHIQRFEGSDVAAYAARVAVQLGRPGNSWVMNQAENPGVSPRTLWALIDHQISDGDERLGLHDIYQRSIVAELRRIASVRFGDVRGLEPLELYHLGELWLLLEAHDQAETTAMDIILHPQRQGSRTHKITALKLLAFASSKRGLDPEAENRIEALYGELWTSYTPSEERKERRKGRRPAEESTSIGFRTCIYSSTLYIPITSLRVGFDPVEGDRRSHFQSPQSGNRVAYKVHLMSAPHMGDSLRFRGM